MPDIIATSQTIRVQFTAHRFYFLIPLLAIFAGCNPEPPPSGSRPNSTIPKTAASPPDDAKVGQVAPTIDGPGSVPGYRRNAFYGPEVGQPALSLEGNDADGKPLKLSDYRGKVVVVDFWAMWCGPCRAMVPHEKELVKRMQGRRFVLLGVNNDNTPEELKVFAEKEHINWSNIYDGNTGPLTRAWAVYGFPTLEVIDATGVYRYANVSDSVLDAVVDKLVKEAENGK